VTITTYRELCFYRATPAFFAGEPLTERSNVARGLDRQLSFCFYFVLTSCGKFKLKLFFVTVDPKAKPAHDKILLHH